MDTYDIYDEYNLDFLGMPKLRFDEHDNLIIGGKSSQNSQSFYIPEISVSCGDYEHERAISCSFREFDWKNEVEQTLIYNPKDSPLASFTRVKLEIATPKPDYLLTFSHTMQVFGNRQEEPFLGTGESVIMAEDERPKSKNNKIHVGRKRKRKRTNSMELFSVTDLPLLKSSCESSPGTPRAKRRKKSKVKRKKFSIPPISLSSSDDDSSDDSDFSSPVKKKKKKKVKQRRKPRPKSRCPKSKPKPRRKHKPSYRKGSQNRGGGNRAGRSFFLDENGVDDLETWFVKNVMAPYPTKKDKDKLSRKTGFSIEQVCNWFSNIRKRKWLPCKKILDGHVKSNSKKRMLAGITKTKFGTAIWKGLRSGYLKM